MASSPISLIRNLNPKSDELALYSMQMWVGAAQKIDSPYLSSQKIISFLAKDDTGKPVGGVLVKDSFGVLFVESGWVLPEFQKKGIGRALADDVIQYGLENKSSHIVGYTYDFYDARNFFRHAYPDAELIGQIENCPPPYTLYFIKKKLG